MTPEHLAIITAHKSINDLNHLYRGMRDALLRKDGKDAATLPIDASFLTDGLQVIMLGTTVIAKPRTVRTAEGGIVAEFLFRPTQRNAEVISAMYLTPNGILHRGEAGKGERICDYNSDDLRHHLFNELGNALLNSYLFEPQPSGSNDAGSIVDLNT